MENTIAHDWKAMQWKWDSLEEKLGGEPLSFRRQDKDPIFILRAPINANVTQLRTSEQSSMTSMNMTIAEFKKTKEKGRFLYHSGLLHKQTRKDVLPTKPFEVQDNLNNRSDISTFALWIGHKGVTAQVHHDKSHNFHAQVMGQKRWRVFPPTAATILFPFPLLHPSRRQSQLSGYGCGLNKEVLKMAPSLANLTAYETITKPGDVIYIPPYWPHCVEATEDSVSVSILSPSDEEISYAMMKWTELPFGRNLTTMDERVVAARLLLYDVLHQAALRSADIDIDPFLDKLHHSRYLLQYPSLADYFTLPIHWECPVPPAVEKSVADRFKDPIKKTAIKIIEKMGALSKGVPEILLGDFTEELAAWAVGVQNVPLFIRQCLLAV